jgi:hypothetical protein
MGDIFVERDRATLCCGGRRCPTVVVDHATNRVIIEDDDGGRVVLTPEQARLIAPAVERLAR